MFIAASDLNAGAISAFGCVLCYLWQFVDIYCSHQVKIRILLRVLSFASNNDQVHEGPPDQRGTACGALSAF